MIDGTYSPGHKGFLVPTLRRQNTALSGTRYSFDGQVPWSGFVEMIFRQ